ncbi:chemotaxis protein CheB [Marivita sp. XM-24bin2]|uniref:chemotaxis protein CheB n=1 Tax=Marivita sp. XM-24bin2 TaxID=2133951 RepID=UPI000D7A504A|nr:chemotaxis protein CheB [Marivita sp. XM-24bin2]PWL33539.1 MAG: chemotaxis protein CheB [Marivita sp. XM-24bin2]
MDRAVTHRADTVVIGGSAGSLSALRILLSKLSADLPASVLVCQHVPGRGSLRAVDLLRKYSTLSVVAAEDGMEIVQGQVIFAPPDVHMMIGHEHVHLRRGAHENNFRPAIDPLFRSAAVYRGTRAIGVILSGLMDDGSAGARAMHRTGGRVLVQSPETADFPDMPSAALDAVPEAEAIAIEDLAAEINSIADTPVVSPAPVPWDIGVELKISGLEGASMENENRLCQLSPYNCPHCNGVLWQIEDGPLTRFRCHTGHAYTINSLNEMQERALDESLFSTLRAHRGRAALIREMAKKTSGSESRRRLEERAKLYDEDTKRLEEIIQNRKPILSLHDAPDW